MSGFSVDTHLLRELGELLVGRESTALLELIKNSYDADASEVIVEAVSLGRPDAILRVVDNGHGMSKQRFESAFLRIASRAKELDDRRSPLFKRRYTGQKGIGRLAAHKLAAWLKVTSIPVLPEGVAISHADDASVGVTATIDWDVIEEQDNLDDLARGLDVARVPSSRDAPHGTALELRRLRASWSDRQLANFVTDLRSAQPATAIADPSWLADALSSPPLIPNPIIRDTSARNDPGFAVRLAGDLDIGEDLWQKALDDFEWIIEIDASSTVVQYQITPLTKFVRSEPEARTYRFQRRTKLAGRPRFQARILTMRNASTRRGPLAGFVRSNSGVRVYLEGFRVLPYGEYGDDWLGIDRDYRTGPRFYEIDIDLDASDQLELDRREALQATPNTGYFGAVFLTEERAGGLRSLVNREGFVPDPIFDAFVDLVQTGIRLSVRVRRAVYLRAQERKLRLNEAEARERAAGPFNGERPDGAGGAPERIPGDPGGTPPPPEYPPNTEDPPNAGQTGTRPADALQPSVLSRDARRMVDDAHSAIIKLRGSNFPVPNMETVDVIASALTVVEAELERLRQIQPELRILASVGLQLGAFVHDVNGMLGQARTLRELLDPFASDASLNRSQAQRIRRVIRALDDLTHTLARQSSYLTDVLVADPRRRRSRARIKERLEVVHRLLSDEISRLNVRFVDNVPTELKTPPMFPAEVGVMLTNLLTNAVKNAGPAGTVRIDGALLGARGATIFVHNTGAAVDLEDAERWFLPFESTTVDVNEVLGQGLGLGLPITRALVEDYRGSIRFVVPPVGFATSVRVDLPDPQER